MILKLDKVSGAALAALLVLIDGEEGRFSTSLQTVVKRRVSLQSVKPDPTTAGKASYDVSVVIEEGEGGKVDTELVAQVVEALGK